MGAMATFPANGGSASGYLAEASVPSPGDVLHTCPGPRHAFFDDTREAVYDHAAAERSFALTLEFFHANL